VLKVDNYLNRTCLHIISYYAVTFIILRNFSQIGNILKILIIYLVIINVILYFILICESRAHGRDRCQSAVSCQYKIN